MATEEQLEILRIYAPQMKRAAKGMEGLADKISKGELVLVRRGIGHAAAHYIAWEEFYQRNRQLLAHQLVDGEEKELREMLDRAVSTIRNSIEQMLPEKVSGTC